GCRVGVDRTGPDQARCHERARSRSRRSSSANRPGPSLTGWKV
ncbi:MAG: hypothetical protein AVDCRST_MAG52-2470, partial [uncultured Blastococcus sp.]